MDFLTQPNQSKHVNNKTSFTGSYMPVVQPALEGRKAGGRWRLCLLFSDNRYLVFYVTLLYRSLKPGRAARLHLPICSPCQLAQWRKGCWARRRDATQPASCPQPQPGGRPALPRNWGALLENPTRQILTQYGLSRGRERQEIRWLHSHPSHPGSLKTRQIPPKSFLKHWDWEKTQLTMAGEGQSMSWGGSSKDTSFIGTKRADTQPRQELTGRRASHAPL